MKVQKYRDLTLVRIDEKNMMVIACDSCGGIGSKQGDVLKVSPYYVGRFTARVGLLEVMCAGAQVVTVVDAVCNEMEPTGKEIIKGIKQELKEANIKDVVLTGSTEENFSTISTGLGVTVVGIVETKRLKIKSIFKSAAIVSIGLPKVGDEIKLEGDEDIVDYETVKCLLNLESVFEIIPVGSKGILFEAENIACNNGLHLYIDDSVGVDINKSAGPSTCILVIVDIESINDVMNYKHANKIGILR